MKVITTRIDDEYFKALQEIEKEEQVDRAEAVRKLLANAIKEWKIKKALSLLKNRKTTIRKAAAIANISYVEMLNLIEQEGIDSGYSLEDLKKDLEE